MERSAFYRKESAGKKERMNKTWKRVNLKVGSFMWSMKCIAQYLSHALHIYLQSEAIIVESWWVVVVLIHSDLRN